MRMLEGLTSRWMTPCFSFRYNNAFTIYSRDKNNTETSIRQSHEKSHTFPSACNTHCNSHLSKDSLWNRTLNSLLQLLCTRSHQLHCNEHISLWIYTETNIWFKILKCLQTSSKTPQERSSFLSRFLTFTPKYFGETHVRYNGTVALDDVRTVMAFQHHIQVHQDPLVLILVSRTTHLLWTQT